MIGIVQDITETHLAEELLKQSEQLFRSTLENLDMIALQLDRSGRVIFANDFLLGFTGWEMEEVLGATWVELFVPEPQRKEVSELFQRFTDNKGPIVRNYQNHILCKNGQQYPIYWNNTPIHDTQGLPIGVCSIGQPIRNEHD
jgi:PAS domain S-box-containing protein